MPLNSLRAAVVGEGVFHIGFQGSGVVPSCVSPSPGSSAPSQETETSVLLGKREEWSQEPARKLHHCFISHMPGPVATGNLDEAGKGVELCALANTM